MASQLWTAWTPEIHDRMPILLTPEAEVGWPGPAVDDPDRFLPRVGPNPAGRIAATPG